MDIYDEYDGNGEWQRKPTEMHCETEEKHQCIIPLTWKESWTFCEPDTNIGV